MEKANKTSAGKKARKAAGASLGIFDSGGELGKLMKARDWSASPLGRPETWSPLLKSSVALMLPADTQIVLFWGDDYCALYNDAYAPTIGDKHPNALGRPAREYWAELWDDLAPMLGQVYQRGQTVSAKNRPFYIERHGYPETAFFDISYSPVRNESGKIEGIICIVNENTENVLTEQKQHRAEAESAAERDRLQKLFLKAPAAIAMIGGPARTYLMANEFYQKIFNRSEKELLGKTVRQAYPEAGGQGIDEIFDTVFETGKPFVAEEFPATFVRKYGKPAETGYFKLVVQPIEAMDGSVSDVVIHAVEITEQVNSRQKVEDSEVRLHRAQQAGDVGTFEWDFDTGGITFSPQAEAIFGYKPGELVGSYENSVELIHPDDRVKAREWSQKAIKSGRELNIEYRIVRPDKTIRWLNVKGTTRFGAGKRPKQLLGAVIDITERKKAQLAVSSGLARQAAFFDTALDAIITIDVAGVVTEFNPAAERIFGYKRQEVLGQEMAALIIPPALRKYHRQGLKHYLKTGEGALMNKQVETTAMRKNGQEFPVELFITRMGDEQPANFMGTLRDISERNMAQDALKASEERFRTLIERSADAVELLDENATVLYSSDSVKNVTGYTPEEIIGKQPTTQVHPDDLPLFQDSLRQLLKHPEQPQTLRYRVRHKNGSWVWLETTGTNHLKTPNINAIVGNFRNITDIRAAEIKLKRSEEQQEFLLALSDALSGLSDPLEVKSEATRMLGEYLGVNRVYYVEVEKDGRHINIASTYRSKVPSLNGRYDLKDYGPKLIASYLSGRSVVISDAQIDERVPAHLKSGWQAMRIGAMAGVPLIKQGKFVAALSMDQATPKKWSEEEIALAEAVAERTWTAVERAKVELELKTSQSELATISAAAPIALWMTDNSGRITFVNQAWVDWTGEPREKQLGNAWSGIIALKDSGEKAGELMRAMKKLQDYHDEFRIKDKRDKKRWLDVTGRPFFEKNGKFAGYAGSAVDITEQRRVRQNLSESQERLQLAEHIGSMGSFEWNITDGRLLWSPAQERLHGIAPGSFSGQAEDWQKFIHPDDLPVVEAQIQRAAKEKKIFESEWRIIRPDGEERVVAARVQLFFDDKGQPERLLGTNMDITDRKRYERQKDEFIAIASHELKTPVTSMKMYAAALERRFRRGGDSEAAGAIGEIDTQLDRLNRLIRDLLDVTKIEAGQLRMRETKFSYDELLKQTISTVQFATRDHHIKLTGSAKCELNTDRDRLSQILTNLIENAIKYSPNHPEVVVSVKCDKNVVTTCVSDNGIGIPKDRQDELFERFSRVGGKSTENYPGLGLGLYITSQIIDHLGGRIWVDSKYHAGSKFYFSLPLNSKQGKLEVK